MNGANQACKMAIAYLLTRRNIVILVCGLVSCSPIQCQEQHSHQVFEDHIERATGSLWNPFGYRRCDMGSFRFDWMEDEDGSFTCLNGSRNIRQQSGYMEEASLHGGGWHRIALGFEVKLGEFPSFVKVDHYNETRRNPYQCSGLLLNKFLVLTAAHCLVTKSAKVVAGQMKKLSGQWKQTKQVRRACWPSEYKLIPPPPYDWAILELAHEFQLNDYVQPGCLNLDFQMASDIVCVAVGVGQTSPTSGSGYLLKAAALENCRPIEENVEKGQYCMKPIEDEEAYGQVCPGDSGGPLYCFENCNGGRPKMYSVGIASSIFVNGMNRVAVCSPSNYAYYTSTLSHREGISRLIRKMVRDRNRRPSKLAGHDLDGDMEPTEFFCKDYQLSPG